MRSVAVVEVALGGVVTPPQLGLPHSPFVSVALSPSIHLQVVLPPTVPATLAYMHETGAYLISNGSLLVLWLGRRADQGLVTQVSRDAGLTTKLQLPLTP